MFRSNSLYNYNKMFLTYKRRKINTSSHLRILETLSLKRLKKLLLMYLCNTIISDLAEFKFYFFQKDVLEFLKILFYVICI